VGALLITLAACGEDEAASSSDGVGGVGAQRVGSVASLAQCSERQAGTREQRLATIHDIRAQLNQAGGVEPTSDLNDQRAYALLQRACANEFASGFRLYKLYARGAAFSRLGIGGAKR
jgi:hypothetical protein